MSGRQALPRTNFSRVACGDPGVAVFRISGALGPSTKPLLVRMTQECLQRDLPRIVLDLSEVRALGGSVARLLNEFAAEHAATGGRTVFRVTSRTVRGFLCADPALPPPVLTASLEEAIAAVRASGPTLFLDEASPLQEYEKAGHGRTNQVAPAVGDSDPLAVPIPFDIEEIEPAHAGDRGGLRTRLLHMLDERNLASRVFLFELGRGNRYFLTTPRGLDPERFIPADGQLARSLLALRAPGFLVDPCDEALSDVETEILTEMNCEVAAPIWVDGNARYLLMLSKARPGDEYSTEELDELEGVLRASGVATAPESTEESATRPRRTPVPWVREVDPERQAMDRDVLEPPSRDVQVLRRSLAQMRDILSLSQDFDATFATPRLLDTLTLSVVSVARVDSVLYFASRDGEYRLTHHRGVSPDAIEGLRLRADSGLVQAALQSRRGVRIQDETGVSEEERLWARQQGLQIAVPFRFKTETLGILLLGHSSEETTADFEMLDHLLGQAALAYDRGRLYETLQDHTLGVVRGLVTLIESRNNFDCGSTEKVVGYTQALAREMCFPGESSRDLVYGVVLRDVGMLKVDDSSLRSAQDLTEGQWEAIRRHPLEGAAIMRQMCFDDVAVDVVLHHHELYNGQGYPMGLRGRAIPLGARIVAVAESYVKMTTDRSNRKALRKAEALESLAENWGLRYDPLVVDALVRVVNHELSRGLKGEDDLRRDLFGV